jgi:hypothetical protein
MFTKKDSMKMKSDIQSCRAALGSLILVCAVTVLSSGAISADKNSDRIDDTRMTLEKWIETRRIISKEKRDLALAKEMLAERIELIRREIDSQNEKIREVKKSIDEIDKKRAGMVKENDQWKNASVALDETLITLETRTRQLIQRLPDPLRARIKPLSQRLPDDHRETELSLAERFQNVVGILNEVDKFNRDILVTSEVRTLSDGTFAEVTALYLGIGQAYYIGVNGTVAGVGFPSEEGWIWKPANDAAARIAQAIAIVKNEHVATYVQLPVEIH